MAVLLLAAACRLNQLLNSSKSPASVPVWVMLELLHKHSLLDEGHCWCMIGGCVASAAG